jgi:hypothetical protein
MWYEKSGREDLKELILKLVEDHLKENYYIHGVKESAERSAHDFVYSSSKVRMRNSYTNLVNDGVDCVMGRIRKIIG